jgi:signal transduction histidine kinase
MRSLQSRCGRWQRGRWRKHAGVLVDLIVVFVQCACVFGAAVATARQSTSDGKLPTEPTQAVTIAAAMEFRSASPATRVRLRGVVTLRDGEGVVIQDSTAGLWVDIRNALQEEVLENGATLIEQLRAGDEIEVVGAMHPGGFAPNIVPNLIHVVGPGMLPKPRPFDATRFFQGADDCLFVEASGIVQGYRKEPDRWLLVVADGSRRFVAEVFIDMLDDPEGLVDQEVSFKGVAIARFNNRGESLWTRLLVGSAGAVSVVGPLPSTPPDASLVPLEEIARFSREPYNGHRIRTQGVVTRASPCDYVYLQQGMHGVRVEPTSCETFAPGDVVEAFGFVRHGERVARIVAAQMKKIGSGPAPDPIEVTPRQIVAVNALASVTYRRAEPGDFIGCLVRFEAELLDTQKTGYGAELVLATDGVPTSVLLDAETFRHLQSLQAGSRIRVTGIVQPWAPPEQLDLLGVLEGSSDQRVHVKIQSADDIDVIHPPSWWTPRHLAMALGICTILAAAFVWVASLRRQVHRQYHVIESTLKAEATVAERQRIAREFHDTLEQDLAAVAMRFDGEAHRAADSAVQGVFDEQRRVVSRIQADAHDFLWDLRDSTRNDGSLIPSLERQIAYLRTILGTPVVLQGADTSTTVSSTVQYHTLRIVREAIQNAANHAAPSLITVAVEHDAETLTIRIADDGHGFDVQAAGNHQGHFGLGGMRERAMRLGGSLRIESQRDNGTVVTLTCPRTLAEATGGREPSSHS